MSISDEIERLDELHRKGVLSRDEFEQAKRKVIEGSTSATESEQLQEIKFQNEIAQLDREWELEREKYMVTGKHGHRHIPSRSLSLLGGIFVVGFGIFWMVMASSITGPFQGGIAAIFPLFGVLFILAGLGMSIYSFFKAGDYEEAEDRYQRRRRELLEKSRRS